MSNVLCVYTYMGVSIVIDAQDGVMYVLYVCLCVYMYVPYETPLVIFYLVVICAVTSIQLHSALGIQHNLRMYIIKHAVVGNGSDSEAMVNWHPDTYVRTNDIYTYVYHTSSRVHTCMHAHTHTLISSPSCSQPLPQGGWYSLQGHTTSRVTDSTH